MAGRIFFKGFRYHGTNETIFIHGGYITWRYWLRRVREPEWSPTDAGAGKSSLGKPEDGIDSARRENVDGEYGGAKAVKELPCRISVSAQGLEWFVYNRTPAYDAIVTSMSDMENDTSSRSKRTNGVEDPCEPEPQVSETGTFELDKRISRSTMESHMKSPYKHHIDRSKASGSEEGRSPTTLDEKAASSEGEGTTRSINTLHLAADGPDNRLSVDDRPDSNPVSNILRILPAYLECSRGAFVLGSEHTRTVLTAKFDTASGLVDASHSQPQDYYKQIISLEFVRPLLQMRPNADFEQSQLAAAARLKKENESESNVEPKKALHWRHHLHLRNFWHTLRRWLSFFQFPPFSHLPSPSSQENITNYIDPLSQGAYPEDDRWRGLSRYLQEEEPDELQGWNSVEYGRVSTVLDSPSVSVSIYWDVPGLVPKVSQNTKSFLPGHRQDINGDSPPEWGLDLRVRGGDINYGPWTDRERIILQSVFLPNSYRDSVPAVPLKAGQPRVSTCLKVRIDIEEQTTLRIPFREESKDWKWRGRARSVGGVATQHRQREKRKWGIGKKGHKGAPGPDIRPFGWLDVKVLPDSTITYTMDMFPGDVGFRNTLDIDLSGAEISSSVNHDLLLRSTGQTISCDLSNPLEWNALHQWNIELASKVLEIFLLRDHIFLLTDLINDWTSGPTADFYTFVPFQYHVICRFAGFKLYLNANDSNIINNPSNVDENTFIVVWGEELSAKIGINLEKYRPTQNAVTFHVDARNGGFELRTPSWNTQNTFLDNANVASLEKLRLTGSYNYHTSTSTTLTDTVILDLYGAGLSVHLFGYLVRYLMKLKDNYFGEDLHFRTLEEFQTLLAQQKSYKRPDATEHGSQHNKQSNDLDVILSVTAEDASALLPANLYSATESVRIDVACVIADLRFTNYYMDLEVGFSPLSISLKGSISETTTVIGARPTAQVFVDDLNVYGYRLFGLPPVEPTYVCNWDFKVGSVGGECSTAFLRTLLSALSAFMSTFNDHENALPSIHPDIIHDVTFLRANIKPIRLWLLVDEVALLISTDAIGIKFNDRAGDNYSERLDAVIPAFTLACVDARTASRDRLRIHSPMATFAYCQTTINISMIERKLGFTTERESQQSHLRVHDQRTRRTEWLLRNEGQQIGLEESGGRSKITAPAMPFPSMPVPIAIEKKAGIQPESESSSLRYLASQSPTRNASRKSSFLSLATLSRGGGSGDIGRNTSSTQLLYPDEDLIMFGYSNSPNVNSSTTATSRIQSRLNAADRHSSYRSQRSDETRPCSGLHQHPPTASSSYAAPHFFLGAAEPDLKDVPDLLDYEASYEALGEGSSPIGEDYLQDSDEKSVRTSFIVELSSGLRAYCRPEALFSLSNLVDHLQSKNPIHIMDSLQMDVLNNISSFSKRKPRTGRTTDITLRIPYAHARFVNSFTSTESNSEEEQDRHNFIISRLAVTTRSKIRLPLNDAVDTKQTLALHLAMASCNFWVEERSRKSPDDKPAIRADINDLVLWALSGQTVSANLLVRQSDLMIWSENFEYLATLIARTSRLGMGIAKTFKTPLEEQKKRIRHLAFALTMLGDGTPDPPFLTRPSYVLRSATDHTRVNDSWKIISRFRYMYQTLSDRQRSELFTQCQSNLGQCPTDVASRVSESFDRWRSWDLGDVRRSYLIQKLYGSMPGVERDSPPQPSSVNAGLSAGVLRILIDPGPKQTELKVETLAVAILSTELPIARLTEPNAVSINPRITVIQTNVINIAIDLQWELWELLEKWPKLYEAHGATELNTSVPISQSNKIVGANQQFHLIIAVENTSVALDSINLKLMSVTKKFGSSIIFEDQRVARRGLMVNIVLYAGTITSQVVSQTHILASSRLLCPRICASLSKSLADVNPKSTWNLAGSCQELSFDVEEDILSLIAVVDLIIGDEIAYVRRALKTCQGQVAMEAPGSAAWSESPTNQVTIALHLDKYRLSLELLPSLTFVILGTVARISVCSRHESGAAIDFDLSGQSHSLATKIDEEIRSVPLMELPPINGNVTIYSSKTETSLEFSTNLETISLDAGALHGLFDTLNRSHISHVLQDVHKSFESLKSHLHDIFEESQPSPEITSVETSKAFFYKARITIAGVEIHATAPGASSDAATAHLNFRLGSLHARVANRLELHGMVLEYPEIIIDLPHVLLELKKSEGSTTQSCGNVGFAACIMCTTHLNDAEAGNIVRAYHIKSDTLEVSLFADTASTVVNVAGYLQDKVKSFDLSKEVNYARMLQNRNRRRAISCVTSHNNEVKHLSSTYSLKLLDIQITWAVGDPTQLSPSRQPEDLVLSFSKIELATKKDNAARLMMEGFRLQMVPIQQNKRDRTLNSALLPEVVFNVAYVSTVTDRRFAFQAAGKSLDLRLTSQFVLPASDLQRSIGSASEKLRTATSTWASTPTQSGAERKSLLGKKRLASLLIDADFAGAVVYIQGRRVMDSQSSASHVFPGVRLPQHGRYGQFTHEDASSSTTLRAPGIALKVEYKDNGSDDPSLNAEIRVDASSNKIFPTVVPLVMEISSSIKEVVGEPDDRKETQQSEPPAQKLLEEETLRSADPSAILGKCKLNVGLQIRKQEFSLSCQPIARVAAIARFEDIYLTINTVQSVEHNRFFAVSAVFTKLQASVQHVYSRESTGNFDIDSVELSLMNSRHVSDASGLSAILKMSPIRAQINAKQLHDFLLFREIWIPLEIRKSSSSSAPFSTLESQAYTVQRYRQVAAAGAFPWNATVSIADLSIQLDMGQALGKSTLVVSDFWVSTKKTSDWEQNLCLGFHKFAVNGTGRMSGFIELQSCRVRTSIQWPLREKALNQTPFIQASLGFDELRVKAAFDYQAFLMLDIKSFEFLMYNVRNTELGSGDRLVGSLDGGMVQLFCTSTSASQGLALYQAVQRLIQEKQAAYETSLRDIERFIRRKSILAPAAAHLADSAPGTVSQDSIETPISLHTDVMVTLRSITIAAFPSTFFDNQVFKFEASNAQASFAVVMEKNRIHTALGLHLGQLRIALSGVRRSKVPKALDEVAVDDVISSVSESRGGTILRVPRVIADMQTWQTPKSNHIDYTFASSFEGKVDVGWNYSRISFIRGMWASHSRSLAQRLGKPLRQSAVQITGGPQPELGGGEQPAGGAEQEKITAVVNVPQSKYDYTALETPIIETPQLRDMGEATPPLEWIGLQRDRLPHLTHQLIIITLLEVAKEVEDAYSKILGSS